MSNDIFTKDFLEQTFNANNTIILSALLPVVSLHVNDDSALFADNLKEYLLAYGKYLTELDHRDFIVALDGAAKIVAQGDK